VNQDTTLNIKTETKKDMKGSYKIKNKPKKEKLKKVKSGRKNRRQ
jgi:hypothetical protein